MQAMASSSSFLAFQEKGLRDVLQKPSKRKFPRSSRASPSLYLLLCLAAAAPKKVSVLSDTVMRPCLCVSVCSGVVLE